VKYNVFFAEDEFITRINVRENAIWKNSPFHLCGDASNGEEAFEKMQTLPVDILITDIRMPFMDGLELSAKVKEHMPHVHIIILSGYSEFEYAQKALKLGVTDYIMKPITPNELLDTLQKVAKKIDKERSIKESLNHLNEIIEQSQQIPIRKYLSSICTGLISEDLLFSEAKRLQINIEANYYIGVIVELILYNNDDPFFLNIKKEIDPLLKDAPDTLYYLENDKDLCFIFKGNDKSVLEDTVAKTCNHLHNYFCKCNIGIGITCDNIKHLWHSFSSARSAIRIKKASCNGEIVKARDISESTLASAYDIDIEKDLVLNLLKFGEESDIPFTLEKLKKQLEISNISSIYFEYIGVEICLTAKNFIRELNENAVCNLDEYAFSILAPCSNANNIDEFLGIISKLLHDTIRYRNQIRNNKYGDIIAEAKKYIIQNYNNPELSLTEVANYVNVCPSYFSSLFSHETGKTFIEYLTYVRIEKAKELLKTSNLRSTDIAFEVGYNDPNHFRKMFKRIVNQSPREYRNEYCP